MIKTQIIIENNKPKAVILDYKEYLHLKEMAEDREDAECAVRALKSTSKRHKHADIKKRLGLE
jgi:hypothetical protein